MRGATSEPSGDGTDRLCAHAAIAWCWSGDLTEGLTP